jgi:predicted RNA-binding Zn ribbon-like protein
MPIRPELDVPTGFRRGPPDDLCLSFANTRYWRGTDNPTEELSAPEDLLRWCAGAVGMDQDSLDGIAAEWASDPSVGGAVHARAIGLREAIYRVFSAGSANVAASEPDLAVLNRALSEAAPRSVLVPVADGWGWALSERNSDLGHLLAPVLWSTGDLLVGKKLPRVRRCANDRCLWLFLDDSKAGTRRWCMMSACGNRAKAHRHYAKMRALR